MGDLRGSSLRERNVEEDREEQARRDLSGTRHMEKIKSADTWDTSCLPKLSFPSHSSPDAFIFKEFVDSNLQHIGHSRIFNLNS